MSRKLFLTLIAVFLAGAQTVYASDLPSVIASPQTFVFNGQPAKAAAVYSQGYNYVKLDDLCKYLDIDAALDQPNKAIYLDKSKPYTGVRPLNGTSEYMCRVVGGLEQLPTGTYSSFSYLAEEYQVKYTVAEGNEENMLECIQSPDCTGNSIYLVDNGYFYFSAGAFARDNNIDVAYDVDSNAVRLDKFKLWAGDYEANWDNYFGLGVRYVDAAGGPHAGAAGRAMALTVWAGARVPQTTGWPVGGAHWPPGTTGCPVGGAKSGPLPLNDSAMMGCKGSLSRCPGS